MATIIHYSNLESPRSIFDFRTHTGYDDHHHRNSSIRVGSPFDDYYHYVRPTAGRRHRRRVPVPVMRRMINRSFLDPWASFENSCTNIFNDLQLEHRVSFDHDSQSSRSDPQLPSDSEPLALAFDDRLLKLFTGLSSEERHQSLYHDRPRIQKHEDEKQWTVDIELPGVQTDDVDVAIEKDHVLHITGKRKKGFPHHATTNSNTTGGSESINLSHSSQTVEAAPESQAGTQVDHATGIQASSDSESSREAEAMTVVCEFKYSYTLPKGIDEDRIQASFENGVLRVSVPKNDVPANRQRRKIAINTASASSPRASRTGTATGTN